MDLQAIPLVWATQAQSAPAAAPASTGSLALLALRRWFGGLTLSSPQALPDLHPLVALLAALLVVLATRRAVSRAARGLEAARQYSRPRQACSGSHQACLAGGPA